MNSEKPNFNSSSLSQEQGEPSKSEKEIVWEQRQTEVNKITDRLDLGIDEKIKEAITAFRVYGFATNQSCEGHAGKEEKHGASFPWIEIYVPEPKDWQKSKGQEKKQIEQEWTIENLKQQQKMMGYFEKFYRDRKTPFDTKLTFDHIGLFGGFRVQSFGAEIMKLLPPTEQHKKLELYRKEMDDFTKFLKDKYFSEE